MKEIVEEVIELNEYIIYGGAASIKENTIDFTKVAYSLKNRLLKNNEHSNLDKLLLSNLNYVMDTLLINTCTDDTKYRNWYVNFVNQLIWNRYNIQKAMAKEIKEKLEYFESF